MKLTPKPKPTTKDLPGKFRVTLADLLEARRRKTKEPKKP